jgi:hypothetical protein
MTILKNGVPLAYKVTHEKDPQAQTLLFVVGQ